MYINILLRRFKFFNNGWFCDKRFNILLLKVIGILFKFIFIRECIGVLSVLGLRLNNSFNDCINLVLV